MDTCNITGVAHVQAVGASFHLFWTWREVGRRIPLDPGLHSECRLPEPQTGWELSEVRWVTLAQQDASTACQHVDHVYWVVCRHTDTLAYGFVSVKTIDPLIEHQDDLRMLSALSRI